jgi:UDP-N-acetylmuramoyl-L-alanyl-D-glutamate--2,6-diaminopimelate ligase
MQLQELLYGVSIQSLVGKPNQEINALTFDSRLISQNNLIFCN